MNLYSNMDKLEEMGAAIQSPGAMPLWLFVGMISATGFIIAGLVNTLGLLTSLGTGILKISFATPLNGLVSILLLVFAGPYWVAAKAWEFWLGDGLPTAIFCMFVIMAVMWSLCSGVVILQLLYSMGLV